MSLEVLNVIANDMDIISMSLGGNNAYKAAMDNACNSGLIMWLFQQNMIQ